MFSTSGKGWNTYVWGVMLYNGIFYIGDWTINILSLAHLNAKNIQFH